MIIIDDDGVMHNVVSISVLEDIKAEIIDYLMDDNVEVGLAEIHEIESIIDKHIGKDKK